MNKKRALVFMTYYLPGFKSGGPVRSLSNMVHHLRDSVEFYIVTRDRDLGDSVSYEGVGVDVGWVKIGAANVLYISSAGIGARELFRAIKTIAPDFYYFNSFFDYQFSIRPLLLLKFFGVSVQKIIVAPRGEFSDAALALKSLKKTAYIKLSRLLCAYCGIRFHASSAHEKSDIRRNFLRSADVSIAIDLPAAHSNISLRRDRNTFDVVRMIFLSRITPMKNIDFALSVLQGVTRRVDFHIYGPIEDAEYWSLCKKLILKLPGNISVKYLGVIQQAAVLNELSNYDLLFLPSRGENYCHVIAESLSVGTPVLISDKTPWRDLGVKGFGWDLPLTDVEAFVKIINDVELVSGEIEFRRRKNVISEYERLIFNSNSISDNVLLFKC